MKTKTLIKQSKKYNSKGQTLNPENSKQKNADQPLLEKK